MKHHVVKASYFVARTIFTNTPVFTILYCLARILLALLPAYAIIISQRVIDSLGVAAETGAAKGLWTAIIALLVIEILQALLNDLAGTISDFLRDKNEKFLTSIISEKLSKIGLWHLEDQKSLNTIHQVMQSRYSFTAAFNTIFSGVIFQIITFVSTLSVIFYYFPLVAVFYFLTTIPATVIGQLQNEKMVQFSIDSIPESRKKDYYYDILTKGYFAKELRLYNLEKTMKDKFNASWKSIMAERSKIFHRGFFMLNISTLISFLGYAGMYVFLIYKTFQGGLSIGGLTAFSGSVIVMSGCLNTIISSLLTYNRVYVNLITAVMDFFGWENEDTGNLQPLDDGVFDIEFQDVSFRYPGTDNLVLDGLSFRIHNAEKVALVGVNGAGKSTIVKLLLRLYEPDSGRILINGRDVHEYDVSSYRKKFAACFQNVVHYSLTYAENIALSDITRLNDNESIEKAAKASGLGGIHEGWKEKLATPLTRRFSNDGVELSGGQWQKVGIARAFFRDVPFVLLDEPSSALDPKAEDEIFSSFAALCGDKSGIIISHRLSSVMLVDTILFLENGKIKESGTHEELMNLGGTYAKMYAMQAEKYRIEG